MITSIRAPRASCFLVAALLSYVVPTSGAAAQTGGAGCTPVASASGRTVLRCAGGLSVTIEAGAQYRLMDRNGDGRIDAVELQNKALLLDIPARVAKKGFEVVTPQAIAAVRGTKWAVDVEASKTSVLVVVGRVAVRRPAERAGVVLRPGEGVDVEANGPLVVKRWPAARVAALLARLGQ